MVLSAQLASPLATPVPAAWRPFVWWASLRADPVRRAAGAALSPVDTEQLLETLEMAVDRRPAGAGYARLSLGPGQRIAAQSGQVMAFQPPGFNRLAPLGPLLRADD